MAQPRKTTSAAMKRALHSVPTAPTAPSTASAIELSGEDAQHLRTQLLLIQHHQSLIQQIDEQAQRFIRERYHVSVAQGSGWQLNVSAGLLEPVKEPDEQP